MSLATRCSACGTIFRVVEDQLKVSDGWVRCGRCDTVFDALDAMVDLPAQQLDADPFESDLPFSQDAQQPAVAAAVDTRQLLVRRDAGTDDVDASAPPQADSAAAASSDGNEMPAAAAAQRTAQPAVEAPADDGAAAPQPTAAALQPVAAAPAATLPPPVATPAVKPSFIRQADRDARWHSPAMRAALTGSSLILLLLLTAQIVYHQRDSIAARSPVAADWLRSACARWNCRIEAPRSLRDVTIENSALTRLDSEAHAARLSLTIRNRGNEALAMPAVELSLTDFEGRLIARKALLPGDFRVDPPVVAADSERPVQVIVRAGENRIAGYTVELFYP